MNRTRQRGEEQRVSSGPPHFALALSRHSPPPPYSERRLVSNTSPRQLHLHTSSSIATLHNCNFDTFLVEDAFGCGRRRLFIHRDSLFDVEFWPQGSPQQAAADQRPAHQWQRSSSPPGARPTLFPNTKHRRFCSHHPNTPTRVAAAQLDPDLGLR